MVQKRSGHDKSLSLTPYALLSYTGDPGDATQFTQYIARNIALSSIRNDIHPGPKACAMYTRKELAGALRTKNAYGVNLLISGFSGGKGELYWMDHLAGCNKLNFGAHG